MLSKVLRFVSGFAAFLMGALLVVALTFPKYPVAEKFFKKNGVLILSSSVSEGVNSLVYKNGKIFVKSLPPIPYRELRLRALPPRGLLICQNGGEAIFKPVSNGLKVKLLNLSCLKNISNLSGEFEITEKGEIFGTLSVGSLRTGSVEVEKALFHLKGRVFSGSFEAEGMTFTGGGKLELNSRGIFVNGKFENGKQKLTVLIRGYLPNPGVEVR